MRGGDARFPRTSQSMYERNLAQGPYANGGTSGNPGSRDQWGAALKTLQLYKMPTH